MRQKSVNKMLFSIQEKIELASAKDIPKYETKLKEIQKGIREYEEFKNSTKPEILKIVKWLNELKAGVLKLGINYKDVKGLNELNDLYWKVNAEAKSSKII